MIALLAAAFLGAAPAAPLDCPAPTPAAAVGGPAAYTMMGGDKPVPPPRFHRKLPKGALESVTIRLDRGMCYGNCPVYSVELHGDGRAVFEGRYFTLVQGRHEFLIEPKLVACLVEQFRAADFWSLANDYRANVTDLPTYRVSLSIGGKSKVVSDYAGQAVGMPPAVTALEQAIDAYAGRAFVSGDETTVERLKAEGFDFRAPAGGQLLTRAADMSPEEVALALLAAGAPYDQPAHPADADEPAPPAGDPMFGEGAAPVMSAAASRGKARLLVALVDAGAARKLSLAARNDLLSAAVASGSAATVAEALRLGPEVNAQDEEGKTALHRIGPPSGFDAAHTEAGQVAIARMLLDAGADPNKRDKGGQTPLFYANGAGFVRLMTASRARLDYRDNNGATPLLTANDDAACVALVEAGSDLKAVDNDGKGVVELASTFHYGQCLALLKAKGLKVD